MRIVYLASTSSMGPASRYRIYQYQRFFQQAGIELNILPALEDTWLKAEFYSGHRRRLARIQAGASGLLRRMKQLAPLRDADLVIVERELFPKIPGFLENYLLRRCKGYGIEFDDAIYLSPGRADKYPRLIQNASFVIAGNDHLAEWASRHQSNVHVVPTCVETSRYQPKPSYELSATPEVGWVGLSSNLPYVGAVAEALAEGMKPFGAKLHILSGRPGNLELPTLFSSWSENIETNIIEQFDIGIMPLPSTDFARGKCGLKILQYMAAGVPVVASAVGVNRTIIKHGINGMLVEHPADWAPAIKKLLSNRKLRESIGRAGRATVENAYSTDIWGPKLVALYRELASSN
jgi:glycosyltransferase involved in cell wall biosynthesis